MRVVVDPKSALYVTGSELDYLDALDGGFKVKNPERRDDLFLRRELQRVKLKTSNIQHPTLNAQWPPCGYG